VDHTQSDIPAPLSIVENTVFPAQAVAGNETSILEPHDARCFPWETMGNPIGCDEFLHDANWTPLVLTQSHNGMSMAAAAEMDEIVNDLSTVDPSNDIKAFRYDRLSTCDSVYSTNTVQ
jgi:hypothetical protein